MTHTVQTPDSAPPAAVVVEPLGEEVDRYAAVEQYSLRKILAVWAAGGGPDGRSRLGRRAAPEGSVQRSRTAHPIPAGLNNVKSLKRKKSVIRFWY